MVLEWAKLLFVRLIMPAFISISFSLQIFTIRLFPVSMFYWAEKDNWSIEMCRFVCAFEYKDTICQSSHGSYTFLPL